MELDHGHQLTYCSNIHRGESWPETLQNLQTHTLAVRDRVCPAQRFGIGLRLSAQAADELAQPDVLASFQKWLERENCYVFTINGFPYGKFHGTRVKEQVYRPDWTSQERLRYTNQLFDILSALLPAGMAGSVSTLPGSFKEFGIDATGLELILSHINACRRHVESLRERTGQDLHLGIEPEPLGLIETTGEALKFFGLLLDHCKGDSSVLTTVGINYDTCHLAVEFEEADHALQKLTDHGIRLSKIHLSSALRLQPSAEALQRLHEFTEDTYLHQVIVHFGDDLPLRRFRDLPDALAELGPEGRNEDRGEEWRVHFHIPIHAHPEFLFGDTREHIEKTLAWLQRNPDACQHLEMETYTWEVLPEELRAGHVVDQIEREYLWCLAAIKHAAVGDKDSPA
jgi:hypothetical protein